METPVQSYSSGMKVRLGFAVAAQMEPDILIIDEVLAVGDVGFRIKCLNFIHKLLRTSLVIFVSHSMPQVSKISSNILFMRSGLVAHAGRNVSYGIEQYFLEFKDGDTSISENELRLMKLKTVTGGVSSEIQAQDTIVVNYLDDLLFEFYLYSNICIKYFGIIIRFFDKALVPVATCQTGKLKYNDHISLTIPRTQLGSGIYSVDIYFVSYHKESSSENILAYYRNFFSIVSSKSKVENQSGIQLQPIIDIHQ